MGSMTEDTTINSSDSDIKLRPINCELNPLTRSDGSALFTQGSTCVLVSLLGPVDVKSQFSNIDKAYIECHSRPKFGMPTVTDKIREQIVKESCELSILTQMHPRTLISLAIQELDDRGGMVACAINAACLALLIAGVPMKFSFAAVHCIIDHNGQIILDPDDIVTKNSSSSITVVFDSLQRDIMSLQTFGHFKQSQLNNAVELCRAASEIIFKFYRKILTNFHDKSLLTAIESQQKYKKNVKPEQMES